MDHWGGHVGQPNRSTAGQSQAQGQGQGQAGRQQVGMGSNYGNGNGQGMRAGSWIAGVRETIDLTGRRNGNATVNGNESGG